MDNDIGLIYLICIGMPCINLCLYKMEFPRKQYIFQQLLHFFNLKDKQGHIPVSSNPL